MSIFVRTLNTFAENSTQSPKSNTKSRVDMARQKCVRPDVESVLNEHNHIAFDQDGVHNDVNCRLVEYP